VLTYIDLYFFNCFSYFFQFFSPIYIRLFVVRFHNFIQFIFIDDFFNVLLAQIIILLNKKIILENKVN